jgi:hypothetical protein
VVDADTSTVRSTHSHQTTLHRLLCTIFRGLLQLEHPDIIRLALHDVAFAQVAAVHDYDACSSQLAQQSVQRHAQDMAMYQRVMPSLEVGTLHY